MAMVFRSGLYFYDVFVRMCHRVLQSVYFDVLAFFSTNVYLKIETTLLDLQQQKLLENKNSEHHLGFAFQKPRRENQQKNRP